MHIIVLFGWVRMVDPIRGRSLSQYLRCRIVQIGNEIICGCLFIWLDQRYIFLILGPNIC